MIRFFEAKNFKSLHHIGLSLSELNLMFGMNGMGKSSVMQTLLLLRQSFWNNNRLHVDELHINGELVNLGTAKDILSQNRENDELAIKMKFDSGTVFYGKYINDPEADISNILRRQILYEQTEQLFAETLFSDGFYYLSAEHVGPQKDYETGNWKRNGINRLGNRGQYAVPFLALEGEKRRVPKELCLETGKTDRLIDQASAWMAEISPGARLLPEYHVKEERASLSISYEGERLTSDGYTPVNVGFGIPYVLPLIVMLLTAEKEDLLLIENPESHLHPRGQSSIGKLIAKVANEGRQIICESHSDHVLNGIRVAVKNKMISKDKVSIKYFEKNTNQETRVIDILTDQNGNLSEFPAGLLDEWGLLLSELIEI